MKTIRVFRGFFVAYSLVALTQFVTPGIAYAEWHEAKEGIMGTLIRVEAWQEDEEKGQAAVQAVLNEMHRINALMSTYKDDSEISQINTKAATKPVQIGDELFGLIQRSLRLSEQTQGAFDITYASAGNLYDYREEVRPSQTELANVVPKIDYQYVKIDPQANTVSFDVEGVRIDLGGIAKGYAVERGVQILREHGIESGIVTAGGDSRILGQRRGRPWNVGIRDPRNRQEVVAMLPLADEAISTSGDYERFFDEDGVRYHHILNPSTGESASEVRSVTIVGPDAVMTDGLSTSVFVMGVTKGIDYINALADYEVVIVDKHGKMHASEGFSSPQ